MFFKEKENDNYTNKESYVEYLLNKYNKLGLNRKETACELGISLSYLDKLLKEGMGLPEYKRIDTKNCISYRFFG